MQALAAAPAYQVSLPRKSSVSPSAWAVVAGGTSILIGILWDISWHRTIGRDTFWTPAHLAIYLGGVLGGLTCGWLVIHATFFATPEEQAGSVRLWGFRGPLGAWITIWGALAMLTSAPFDNWWHDAYGVDVKILSPPHTVLALGMWGTVLGALILVLREQNRSGGGLVPKPLESKQDLWGGGGPPNSPESDGNATQPPAPGRRLFIYLSGVIVVMGSVFLIEHSWPNQQRTNAFYQLSAHIFPLYLLGLGRASKYRWGATWIALVYMGLVALTAWVLPLFPGQPRLGPIYNPIRHFVPLPFPLLLVVPALGIDLLRLWIGQGRGWRRDWLLAMSVGIAFLGLFLLTQWFFSAFLIGPGGQNWFFAADRHWGYREGSGDWRFKFWSDTYPRWNPPLSTKGLLIALGLSLAGSRIGLWLGNWMSKVRR